VTRLTVLEALAESGVHPVVLDQHAPTSTIVAIITQVDTIAMPIQDV
jgi:hypothetical protein